MSRMFVFNQGGGQQGRRRVINGPDGPEIGLPLFP